MKLFAKSIFVCTFVSTKTNTMKTITKKRISRIITALIESPNKSASRAALWKRLHDLRNSLN